ncbi:type II toxin-antitoxin system toxin DNA ADP-ribosyl transferase DarT [Hansschlegelia plantiphila]|uniref:DarT domain-containing protein n=1 Tax=Hansschlegelia plantiphila TaxID=374655 RepID=A0A9W6MVS9_9HYPH|nr:DUF4433 domain-containing protein [Hansschlegelia plantiphila]GLK68110.1 hypothetical protein GCM10008179_17480 [Hansschlegelia plantiphila]
MAVPARPKIYHIVHVDRLASIVLDGRIWSDAEVIARASPGTTIGMSGIKARRLRTKLDSHPDLAVGDCAPFYFCPRSIMLYIISMANHPELSYRGGQAPIVTLEADLQEAVEWAGAKDRRWAFTLSNAGSSYFDDRDDLADLGDINWDAIAAGNFRDSEIKEGKQAEFLMERSFPWHLVRRIGVYSSAVAQQVANTLRGAAHRPPVEIRREWYY